MNQVIVVYDSRYGQAQTIAIHAGDLARRAGLEARVVPLREAEAMDLAKHTSAVVVVAPIYFSRHPARVGRFLRVHADVLRSIPTAFVSVSNSAANADPGARAHAREIANRFVASVGLRPQLVATAGGALAYPTYGFVLRHVMRAIARKSGQSLDTSRRHELTDWKSLDAVLQLFFDGIVPMTADSDARSSGVFPAIPQAFAVSE